MARRSLGYTPSVVVVENISRKVGSQKTRQYQNEKKRMYIQTNPSPHAKQIQYKLRPTDRQTDTMRGS